MTREASGDKNSAPSYGAASKYLGAEGEAYFQQQNASGILASKYNEFIFKPYVSEADDVLDFGCGGGHLLNALEAKTKTGVEINPAARRQAAKLGLLVYSSIEEVSDHSFSRIITSHALEHVPSPFEALVQLRRLLKPNGLLVWLSPLDDWRAANQRGWNPDDADMHLYAWTPLLLGNLLKLAGYKPESISILTHAFPPAMIGERFWKLNPALFHFAARVWAMILKQRQIVAVASI
jgi:SAM-dependent methyltransferase